MEVAYQMEMTRKRGRDDDIEDVRFGGTSSFAEHRSKRLQALPLRSSPRSQRAEAPPSLPNTFHPFPHPRTITPINSDSDEFNASAQQQQPQHYGSWPPSPNPQAESSAYTLVEPPAVDGDMDMMDTAASDEVHSPQDPKFLGPGTFHPDPVAANITGRMPTPIHCSFAQQVRGNNWSGAAGGVLQGQESGSFETTANPLNAQSALEPVREAFAGMDIPQENVLRPPARPSTADVMAEWSNVQNRRLPSPISEGDDGTQSPAASGLLDPTRPAANVHGHSHPAVASLPQRSSSALELSQLHSTEAASSANAMDIEQAIPPSPKKGHARSRHTINSWTAAQPGMKKSFSIGYRADCEKCRLKVPGHFNHIIVS